MPAKFPCKLCNNPVESCAWHCISCSSKIFPFSNLNEDDFHKTIHGKKVSFSQSQKKETKTSKYLLKN